MFIKSIATSFTLVSALFLSTNAMSTSYQDGNGQVHTLPVGENGVQPLVELGPNEVKIQSSSEPKLHIGVPMERRFNNETTQEPRNVMMEKERILREENRSGMGH